MYFIDKRGIFSVSNTYHDDLEYVYLVEFNKEDTDKQFKEFQEILIDEGKRKKTAEIRNLLIGQ